MSFCCKFFGCYSRSDENTNVQIFRASYSTSLRGNLVRTYKTNIDNDYYIDNDHELGKGGCGVVVVGEHKENHSQFAIKIVNKSTAERGRLDRELKLLKDVDHANIVRLFSLYDLPTHMYFVMELCLGGHLGNLLSRQSAKCVDEDWGRKLSRQLISAVAHIHSRGIAHRDIKLQNILIDNCNDRTAQLKLIDFGYGSRDIGALPMKTKCGTPYTTAPEVIRECYDERCDVWSMGVVIYIMLCGRRPFEALDIPGPLADAGKASMITNILAGRYHFNHKAWQNVSKAGISFVKSLLHPDYKTRIRSNEALEVPWLSDGTVLTSQTAVLKSAKSFHAVTNMRRSSEASDMQRTGMVALVFGINSKAATDLRNVFQSFDSDGSGMLSRQEFEKALHEISPDLTSQDINHLFDIVDMDKNKQISYSEFLAATLDPNEVDIEELSKAFKLLDEDGNGFITRDELRKVLIFQYEQAHANHQTINNGAVRRNSRDMRNVNGVDKLQGIVDDKVSQIFNQVDLNGDGVISHSEFLCAMTGLDFYLDPSEAFLDDEEEEEDLSDEEHYRTDVRYKNMNNKQASVSSYQSSNKNQNADLADEEVNGEYEYIPEEDGDDVQNTIDRASNQSDANRLKQNGNSGVVNPGRTPSNRATKKTPSNPPNARYSFNNGRGQSSRKLEPIVDDSDSMKHLSRNSSLNYIRRDNSKASMNGNSVNASGAVSRQTSVPKIVMPQYMKGPFAEPVPLSAEAMALINVETPEGSPRRGVPANALGGKLAFYGEQANIEGNKGGYSEEESNSSSYGINKVNGVFGAGGSQRGQVPSGGGASPGRISPIIPTNANGSRASGTASPSNNIYKAGPMSPTGSSGGASATTSGKIVRDQSPPPVMLNASRQHSFKGLGQVGRASSFKQRAEFSDIRDGDDDRPPALNDLRASFAAMGRAPSYRNTMIIENSSNNDTIRVLVDEPPPIRYGEESLSRKAHRNSLNNGLEAGSSMEVAGVETVESNAPPPLLRMGSKAFSFKGLNSGFNSSRPTTSRQGVDDDYSRGRGAGDDFPVSSNDGGSAMYGGMKRMLSVGKMK